MPFSEQPYQGEHLRTIPGGFQFLTQKQEFKKINFSDKEVNIFIT